MLRGSLLDGANAVYDKDYSKLLEAVSDPGVMSGFNIVAGKLQPGEAFVHVTRASTDSFYCFVENTAEIDVDVTGTKKIWLEVKQASIDDGITNAPDGGNILELKNGASYPTKNFLKIASVLAGVVTDDRYILDNIQDLKQALQDQLDTHKGRLDGLDTRVDDIEASLQPPSALVNSDYIAGEAGVMGDSLFPETGPTYAEATNIQNICDIVGNTRVARYDVSSGVFAPNFKSALKKFSSPSVNLNCRLQAWNGSDYVDVDAVNAVSTIAPGSLPSSITDAHGQTLSSIGGVDAWYGFKITMTKTVVGLLATKVATSGHTDCRIINSVGTTLQTVNFVGDIATFTIPLSAGQTYRIESSKPSYTLTQYGTTALPQNKINLNFVGGSKNGADDSYGANIVSITSIELADTTMTWAGTFTAPVRGTPIRYVYYAGTYGSETVNANNYYGIGNSIKDTTTRYYRLWDGTTRSPLCSSIIDTANVSYNAGGSRNGSRGYRYTANYDLYLNSITKDASTTATKLQIKSVGGAILETVNFVGNVATLSSPRLFTLGSQFILEVYNNGSTFTSRYYSSVPGLPRTDTGVVRNQATQDGADYPGNNSWDIVSINTQKVIKNSFIYLYSALSESILLSKTDADYTYKLASNIHRLAKSNYDIGDTVEYDFKGIIDYPSAVVGNTYYTSNTPGQLSTSPGTNSQTVGTCFFPGKIFVR